jgi:streptogramin lyase
MFSVESPESLRCEQRVLLALSVTSFPIPLVGIVQPQGITTGPDGNLWFAETGADKIGCMTPAGVVTQYPLPPIPVPAATQPTPGSAPGPVAITVGPDGALWFVGVPGEVGRITTGGVVTEFSVPDVPPPAGSPAGTAPSPATLTSITAGPDGALWFTGIPGEVGRITTSGVVTEFPVPAVPPPAGSPAGTAATPASLTGITVGPDGALWFAGVPGEVGRITTSGVVTEFVVPEIPPPAGSAAGTAGSIVTPAGITAGPDGALWFTDPAGGNSFVGRITTTGVVTEYAAPNLNSNATIVTGPDGDLWFNAGSSLARITASGVVTSFSAPGNFNQIAGLTPGPNGSVWFTEEEDGSTVGEQPAVGAISPAGVMSLFPIPQGTTLDPNRGIAVDPTAVTTGPDGAIWFADNVGIGRITTTGTIEQFPLTTPGATVANIASGPEDTLWFTQLDSNENWSIGRMTTSGAITLYPLAGSVSGIVEASDGDLWFTETLQYKNVIGRITPKGAITTFRTSVFSPGAITIGPGDNVWFSGSLSTKKQGSYTALGEVTATGHVKVYDLPSTLQKQAPGNSYPDASPSNLISGPDGELWFDDQVGKTTGIARISTRGKLGTTIPTGPASELTRGPDGRVWFLSDGGLGVATRSGIVVTTDVSSVNGAYEPVAGVSGAFGPDGNLWLASGSSSIVRVSGVDTPLGGLDYRHRPRRKPDYVRSSYGNYWTNTSSSAQPTFAGIAKPGSELTLWAQMQGQTQPVSLGRVKANAFDGSWTLKSKVRLNNGNYAVTATQAGQTGPASVLYSLEPDSSGNLSNALVIDAQKPARSTS